MLELILQILLIVRNFFHSKESDSFITLVYSETIHFVIPVVSSARS